MSGILERLRNKPSSADTARQRLQLVLIHDRANLPAGQIELMKEELIKVISRYVEVDRSKAEVVVENEGREQRLSVVIPLSKENRSHKG